MKANSTTSKMIMTGLMTALITIATMVIIIPVPFTGGYVHLGDCMIFLSVFVLGWKYGAFAAGFGSMLADLLTGFAMWAPWTLVIKCTMAVFMGLAIEKCMNKKRNIIWLSFFATFAWIAFNVGVQGIIKYTSTHNAASLLSEDTASTVSELGTFLNNIQGQLMLVALLIPVFLILISIYVRRKDKMIIPIYQILGMTISGLTMVFGYYIAGGIILGNFAVAAFSIPANMIQFIVGFFISMLLVASLRKTPAAKYFTYIM